MVKKFSSYFISNSFLDQPYVAGAAVQVIACSMQTRCMQKYEDRGYRYILFEAGHIFQNMNLCSPSSHRYIKHWTLL
ncbi:MAG: hypothetical protein ABIO81_08960 [Ginsengibacter sp.]